MEARLLFLRLPPRRVRLGSLCIGAESIKAMVICVSMQWFGFWVLVVSASAEFVFLGGRTTAAALEDGGGPAINPKKLSRRLPDVRRHTPEAV